MMKIISVDTEWSKTMKNNVDEIIKSENFLWNL